MTQLALSFKQINAKLPCNRIPTAAGAGRAGSPRYVPYHGGGVLGRLNSSWQWFGGTHVHPWTRRVLVALLRAAWAQLMVAGDPCVQHVGRAAQAKNTKCSLLQAF